MRRRSSRPAVAIILYILESSVNRRPILTPDRHPILTPCVDEEQGPARRNFDVVKAGWTLFRASGAVLEAPRLVACFHDLAVVGQPVEECGGHFGVAEDRGPFAEGEVGGDDDRGAFVELADQMEEELPAGLGEGQIAELVEDDEVEAVEVVGRGGPACRCGPRCRGG